MPCCAGRSSSPGEGCPGVDRVSTTGTGTSRRRPRGTLRPVQVRRSAVSFRVVGLPSSLFRPLYGLSDRELVERGVEVKIADAPTGFPCRVSLRDALVGARMLLLNFEHQPAPTPYRSRHAIFVEDGAEEAHPGVDEVPEALARRTLSV